MTVTVNGMVAKANDSVCWSDEMWGIYLINVKAIGCLVLGRRTLELMRDEGGPDSSIIYDVPTVCVTSGKVDGFECVRTPQEALDLLSQRGFNGAVIGGGTQLNTSFLKAGLVDELILDIEPYIFGDGIPLFSAIPVEHKLELLAHKMLNAHTLNLHYRVLK